VGAWFRDVLLLLGFQVGISVLASAITWFTIRQPLYTQAFAAIPAGAMLFALVRRKRPSMRLSDYRRLLAIAGAIGWGTAFGLLLIWLKFLSGSGARLPGRPLFIGFLLLWGYYLAATLFGLWSGSYRKREKTPG
jgi:hypothetical protein